MNPRLTSPSGAKPAAGAEGSPAGMGVVGGPCWIRSRAPACRHTWWLLVKGPPARDNLLACTAVNSNCRKKKVSIVKLAPVLPRIGTSSLGKSAYGAGHWSGVRILFDFLIIYFPMFCACDDRRSSGLHDEAQELGSICAAPVYAATHINFRVNL